MTRITVFILLTFCAWILSSLFDAGKKQALSGAARLAMWVVPCVAPPSQRQRVRDEVEDFLCGLPPTQQLKEAMWWICRLLAVRSGARALERTELHGLAAAAANLGDDFFAIAAAGGTSVSADEEPLLSMRSVENCRSSMLTISYREDDWWPSTEGLIYLAGQQRLIARGGHIERVFIIPEDSSPTAVGLLQSNMRSQVTIGIDVLYVQEVDLPPRLLEFAQDFIVYDERLLRTTLTVPRSGLAGRDAQLHTDSDVIRRGLDWFEELKSLSIRFPHPA